MTAVARRVWKPLLAALAITYLLAMVFSGALPGRRQLVTFEAAGVLALGPETITRVTVKAGDTQAAFTRQSRGWMQEGDTTTIGMDRTLTLERAIKFMHTANPVRVLKLDEIAGTDRQEFGLDDPILSVTLETKTGAVLTAYFGKLGPDGMLRYMGMQGRNELYLMSGFVSREWESVANAAKP